MSVFSENLKTFVRNNLPKHSQTNSQYVFNCPKDNCNGKNKLYLSKKTGKFLCFKCKDLNSFYGKAEYALTELTTIPIKDIQSELYGIPLNGIPVIDLELDPIEQTEELYEIEITKWPEDFYPIEHPLSVKGANYLKSRNISLDLAIKYGIYYHPTSQRVCFPVYDGKDLCGWQGRLIFDHPTMPKARTSPGLQKSHLLMFASLIPKECKHVIVTEGPVDAIRCDGLYGNVCTMGKSVSDIQIQRVLDLSPETVYLALDADAYIEMRRLTKAFYGKTKLKLIEPLPGLDLGGMTFEQVHKAFTEAKDLDPNNIFAFLR
jgi:hypothetical protein